MVKEEELEKMLNNVDNLIDYNLDISTATSVLNNEKKDYDTELKPGGLAKGWDRANKNCNLSDCIRMIGMIVDYDLKDYKVEFTSNEYQIRIKDPEIAVNHPYISYKVISRKPSNEYKPIIREEVNEYDEYNRQRAGAIFGQTFDCIVQFNIFATESIVADTIMNKFEELILNYTGYLKQEGVAEIYFKEQVTDSDYNNFRETLSVKNLRYYVKIDILRVILNRRMDYIDIYGDAIDSNQF